VRSAFPAIATYVADMLMPPASMRRRGGSPNETPSTMKGKTMRNLTRAFFLVLALSCVAHAGEMPCPAPSPQLTSSAASEGNMPFPASDTQQEASTVTEIALNLLVNVLSLF
jgi:hypothetical protein